MNRLIILLIVLICYGNSLRAQEIEYSRPVNTPESCTSILVGKKASADGSVMTSHTCDGNYRTWMEIVPAARYERDTTVAIYNGRMHTEYPADRTNNGIERDNTGSPLDLPVPEHRLPLPQRKTVGYRRNDHLRAQRVAEQERYVHDRGVGKDSLAALHDSTRSDTADRTIGCRTWLRGFGGMPDDRRPE